MPRVNNKFNDSINVLDNYRQSIRPSHTQKIFTPPTMSQRSVDNYLPKRYYTEHKCLVCKEPMFYNRSRSIKMVRLTHWECHYYDKVFKKKRT